MSRFESELQVVADRVVEQARPGEQIEAFVARGGETEVRVYQGDVEHFVSAQSEGVGIRVIRDGRTGFAYAGTLDEDAIREDIRATVRARGEDPLEFAMKDVHTLNDQPMRLGRWVDLAREVCAEAGFV